MRRAKRKLRKFLEKANRVKCIRSEECLCQQHRKLKKAKFKREERKTLYKVGFEYAKHRK